MDPTVLFIVDCPGWAHDAKTKCLQRELSGRFRIETRYNAQVTAEDIRQSDLVVVYYWLQLHDLRHVEHALRTKDGRLLMGICGPAEIEGDRREPGMDTIRRLASAVFLNNLQTYRDFQGAFDCPLYYTPNGVDTRFYTPGPPRSGSGDLIVGWAGSLINHGPGLRGFRDVIVPAIEATPGSRLTAAIREVTWRNATQMRDFYHSLDVYVCASRSEGTPNPCLEAAACGLPLISTRVGNMPELVEHGANGFLIDRTAEALAESLCRLRDQHGLSGKMGRAMRAEIQKWDWSRQSRNYERMFDEVLARL
jgi:hypothetical protein